MALSDEDRNFLIGQIVIQLGGTYEGNETRNELLQKWLDLL